MTTSNGATHNCFYVRRDITEWYEDGSLWDRIEGTNGYDEFEGIFPGCYFNMSRNITAPYSTKTGTKEIVILGCNSLSNAGHIESSDIIDSIHGIYYRLTMRHIVCAPHNTFGSSSMNDTDTTDGGYYGSKMNQEIIGLPTTTGDIGGTINQQLYAEFGNHLISWRDRLSISIDENAKNNRTYIESWTASTSMPRTSGMTNNTEWKLIQSTLMNEAFIYGSIMCSNSAFDIGCLTSIPPAYSYSRNIVGGAAIWLRDIANKNAFSVSQAQNSCSGYRANQTFGIKPVFILAK